VRKTKEPVPGGVFRLTGTPAAERDFRYLLMVYPGLNSM
jgi:hypothetical protein